MEKKVSYSGSRDPRFVTNRRGGELDEKNHQLLIYWAADCAEHVLEIFRAQCQDDARPAFAIEQARAWAKGEISMSQAREAAFAAHDAAKNAPKAAQAAARAAGHAVATAHMADHVLGAAAYAIKAVQASFPSTQHEAAGREECEWQREQLPEEIRALVLSDQENRNKKFWSLFYK